MHVLQIPSLTKKRVALQQLQRNEETQELRRKPKGFWLNEDNQRRFLKEVAADLNLNDVRHFSSYQIAITFPIHLESVIGMVYGYATTGRGEGRQEIIFVLFIAQRYVDDALSESPMGSQSIFHCGSSQTGILEGL